MADFDTYFVGEYGVLVHNYGYDKVKSEMTDDVLKKIQKKLGPNAVDEFIKAMNKGIVGAKGQSGIKVIKNMDFKYEIKVFGELSNWRVYGNFDKELGEILFTFFGKALH